MTILLALCFWLTSLDFGSFRPEGPAVTFGLWALSTCVVLGTLALGFLVFRNLVKLYLDRRAGIPGSRIRTKLVFGVLALSAVPVAIHVLFSITLLNRNLDKWFSQPTVGVLRSAERLMDSSRRESLTRLAEQAEQVAARSDLATPAPPNPTSAPLRDLLQDSGLDYLAVVSQQSGEPWAEVTASEKTAPDELRSIPGPGTGAAPQGIAAGWLYATASIPSGTGFLVVGRTLPESMAEELAFMQSQVEEWKRLEALRPTAWRLNAFILAMITLFMLFIAVWLALFASKQITRPVEALVRATGQLAGGHLDYRVHTAATDELAGLVESFNQMGQTLEAKTRQLEESNRSLARANTEIEDRRRFINTILESITPGVVSVDAHKKILKFNDSARRIAGSQDISSLESVTELLDGENRLAFDHMFGSAGRTGIATRDFELERMGRPVHLSVTVSSLDPGDRDHGFVVVLEDTTELLRAQRSEAWEEVARRVAHEIKNPLTPIALAAGRIDRLLERYGSDGDDAAIREGLARCTSTIQREVASLQELVDSFSHLARFPTIQPEEADLNALVREAVAVFDGRLPDISLRVSPDPSDPRAMIDPEPFKRALVNLIDNAAEALEDCWVKEIVISTRSAPDSSAVEVTVADSGPGISREDKEKLFLPYFSTKKRGTGLGLPITRSIIGGHCGSIRVEANAPTGSQFIIEIPAANRSREVVA